MRALQVHGVERRGNGAPVMTIQAVNPGAEQFSLQWPNAAEALAFASGGSFATSDVVFKPAGPAVPGLVYTTWAEACAALVTKQAGATLWLAASASADSSVAADLSPYQLRAMIGPTASTPTLTIQNGVTLGGFFGIVDNVWVFHVGAGPVVTVTAGRYIELRGNSVLFQNFAGGHFFSCNTAVALRFLVSDNSALSASATSLGLLNVLGGAVELRSSDWGAGALSATTVAGAAGTVTVYETGSGGTVPGYVEQPGYSGTVQHNELTRRTMPCGAGTMPGAAGFQWGFLVPQPSAGPTLANPEDVQFTDQRRMRRVVCTVLANSMAAVTRVEVTADGIPLVPPVYVDVPAGSTGKHLGARVNAASSNWTTLGGSVGLSLRASCTGGGVGNSIQLIGAVEYT